MKFSVVFVALLAGCAGLPDPGPRVVRISEPEQPIRGEYPRLIAVREDGLSSCSWGRVGVDTYITAKHCLALAQGWVVDGDPMPAPIACADERRDSAYLMADRAPAAPIEPPIAAPRRRDRVCYQAYTGRRNCGTVDDVLDDRAWVRFDGPVIPGESGSPVLSPRGLVGVIQSRVEGSTLGTFALPPVTCVPNL